MDQSNHLEYYHTRAEVSRELAPRAADPAIAAIHTEFASRYDSMAAEHERKAGTENAAQAA